VCFFDNIEVLQAPLPGAGLAQGRANHPEKSFSPEQKKWVYLMSTP